MALTDIEIETKGAVNLVKRIVVDGHDLSPFCKSVEVKLSVNGVAVVRPTLLARSISLHHEDDSESTAG